MNKRRKEEARKERQRMKAERRVERSQKPRPELSSGEDPDIAGIVPGPQAPLEDFQEELEIEEEP